VGLVRTPDRADEAGAAVTEKLAPWKKQAPNEKYVPAVATDIRERFKRIKAELRKKQSAPRGS